MVVGLVYALTHTVAKARVVWSPGAVGALALGSDRLGWETVLGAAAVLACLHALSRLHENDCEICERRPSGEADREEAARVRVRLLRFHLLDQTHLSRLVVSVGVVGSVGVACVVLSVPLEVPLAVTAVVALFLQERMRETHHRLRAWCPECAALAAIRSRRTYR